MASQDAMEVRAKIVKEYIPLVKHIASRVSLGKNKYIEYEDLVGYGMIGLMDAINRFDDTKGMKFSSYAALRIKGSMIDELRKQRPISKNAMDKLKAYNECVEKLQTELLRDPTTEEVMAELGATHKEILEVEGYINYMAVVSLDEVIFSDDDEMNLMGVIEDKKTLSPEQEFIQKEKIEILGEAIEELKEKDRIVLNLYYYEELTLKEIGKILEVSESRVCQLHSRAIRNLREKMKSKFSLPV
ncbi:FliA/WhiG family RNA polymerase sigma factor [Clostridium chrysemydis]|uniref:FliA/WhiG family RNA polymerase sigma factor n=1 Tax=Clostridium chrysemydis TaxID=2665504 RepID=UPI0018843D6A|nr:FliA/WhiG family RNA polymerase sigma factor [Clostridium chrysemydis]